MTRTGYRLLQAPQDRLSFRLVWPSENGVLRDGRKLRQTIGESRASKKRDYQLAEMGIALERCQYSWIESRSKQVD
jgi:hypothetical protein